MNQLLQTIKNAVFVRLAQQASVTPRPQAKTPFQVYVYESVPPDLEELYGEMREEILEIYNEYLYDQEKSRLELELYALQKATEIQQAQISLLKIQIDAQRSNLESIAFKKTQRLPLSITKEQNKVEASVQTKQQRRFDIFSNVRVNIDPPIHKLPAQTLEHPVYQSHRKLHATYVRPSSRSSQQNPDPNTNRPSQKGQTNTLNLKPQHKPTTTIIGIQRAISFLQRGWRKAKREGRQNQCRQFKKQIKQLISDFWKITVLYDPNSSVIVIKMARVLTIPKFTVGIGEIRTISQYLPLKGSSIVVIGHSPQSLRSFKFIYVIYDTEGEKVTRMGNINTFGIIFLTPYIWNGTDGCFTLINSSGSKRIIRESFGEIENAIAVKEVKVQKFSDALSEEYTLYYCQKTSRIYLLQQIQLKGEEMQLALHVYSQGLQLANYRIVTLEQPPFQVIFSPLKLALVAGPEVALYGEKFQPQYFTLSNMEQFNILGFYHDFILQLRSDSSVFTMSLSGAIRPLLDLPVISYSLTESRLFFLLQGPNKSQRQLKIFRITATGIQPQPPSPKISYSHIIFATSLQVLLQI